MRYIIMIIITLQAMRVFSQDFTVRGVITDDKNQNLEFANIILEDSSKNTYIGTTSDKKGEYKIITKAGVYDLIVNFIGFKTFRTKIVIDSNVTKNITLKEASTQLKEVVVTSSRPEIIMKNDRYEINIANSIVSKGNSVEELLIQLPGVWATKDGDISINGVKGSRVMINNRLIKLTGNSLMNYLKSFRSEDISKIEVVQNPSSEFDAEGTAGIIKIITKKNITEGYRGVLGNKFDYQYFNGVSPFLSFSYNMGKFGVNLSANGQSSKWLLLSNRTSRNKITNNNYNIQGGDTIYDKSYSFNTDFFYKINNQHNMSLNFNYVFWSKDEYIKNITNVKNNTSIYRTDTEQKELQNMKNFSVTYNYDFLLDKKGNNKIELISDYVRQFKYNIDDYFEHINYTIGNQFPLKENIHNNQTNPFQLISSEIKYTSKLDKNKTITSGIKYSNSTIENSLSNYSQLNGNWLLNENIGYNYKYKEQLISSFIQYDYNGHNWNLKGGLRAEYNKSLVLNFTEKKFNIFPALFFTYHLNQNNVLGISYTRRIERISYMKLIPRRYYISKYNIIEGNPLLTPNIINNIGGTYKIRNKYYISASYRWGDNFMSKFNSEELINGNNIIVSSYIDGVKARLFNLNCYIPVKILNWWQSTNQINVNLKKYEMPTNTIHGFSYSIYSRQDFQLPWKMKLQILYRYLSSSKNAYTFSYPYHLLNLTLQKAFFSNKLNMKIEAGRVLYNQKMSSEVITPIHEIRTDMYYKKCPFFSFTISYSINKGKLSSFRKIKKSNRQEKQRTY